MKSAATPLSLSYYTVPELAPPAMVRAAADAGFDFVGVRLLNGQPGRDPAPLLENPALRRETLACLRDTGIKVLDASGARLVPTTDLAAFLAAREPSLTYEVTAEPPAGVPEATLAQARLAVAGFAAADGPWSPETAVAAALAHHLVTADTGAVVLERQEQYEQNGLEPAGPQSVPNVPEPGTIALLLAGGAAALAARRKAEAAS